MMKFTFFVICLLVSCTIHSKTPAIGSEPSNILYVDKHNPKYFSSIQQAIDASTHFKRVIILISAGEYNEKLFITCNNLSLVGQSQSNTRITFPELRNNWRKNHDSDWGAAVVNINGSDINIVNLQITNHYGREHNTNEHQFAVRSFENATRITLHQCNISSDGADTLSLWNKKDGLYYHSYCSFTGATDMVCPRGTALIEHSKFFNIKQSATLWHDGELNVNQKLVVNDSEFDGVKGFWLGRHHYDAQFYLINNQFSSHMADKPIFKKTYPDKSRNKANKFGARYFFANNQNINSYSWARNNFQPTNTYLAQQTVEQWVFGDKWQPNAVLHNLAQQINKTAFATDSFSL